MTDAAHRRRQILAVAAIEMRRRFLGKRAIALWILTLFPIGVFTARVILGLLLGVQETVGEESAIYAILYRTLILRFTIFLGCLILFTSLFRGEILDRTLHYGLLAPMRRSTYTVGKYVSGVFAATVYFGATTALTWILAYLAHGPAILAEKLFSPEGLGQLLSYLAATVLACVGYGALFLVFGLRFRSPIIPALIVLGWENANFLLPSALKQLSVIHYVESLLPIPVSQGPVAILADPASPWLAVPGIALLAAGLLWIATRVLSRTEILYGAE